LIVTVKPTSSGPVQSAMPPKAAILVHPEITDKDIEEGLSILAWLIDRYGDAAWPLFERLEKELESRQKRKTRIQSRLTDKFG